MSEAGIDRVLRKVASHMDLDTETEQELIEEIRSHLEESVAAARARGLHERAALVDAASRFGVEEVGAMLQQVHAGWGTADAVYTAALPVACTLALRWTVYSPDGTVMGWPRLLNRPAFWVVSAVALAVPLLKFRRWRYGLLSWGFFWGVTVISAILPALRW